MSIHSSSLFRSNRPEMFHEKSVLKNFVGSRKTILVESLYLKRCRVSICNFMQKETLPRACSCVLAKLFRTSKLILSFSGWDFIRSAIFRKDSFVFLRVFIFTFIVFLTLPGGNSEIQWNTSLFFQETRKTLVMRFSKLRSRVLNFFKHYIRN